MSKKTQKLSLIASTIFLTYSLSQAHAKLLSEEELKEKIIQMKNCDTANHDGNTCIVINNDTLNNGIKAQETDNLYVENNGIILSQNSRAISASEIKDLIYIKNNKNGIIGNTYIDGITINKINKKPEYTGTVIIENDGLFLEGIYTKGIANYIINNGKIYATNQHGIESNGIRTLIVNNNDIIGKMSGIDVRCNLCTPNENMEAVIINRGNIKVDENGIFLYSKGSNSDITIQNLGGKIVSGKDGIYFNSSNNGNIVIQNNENGIIEGDSNGISIVYNINVHINNNTGVIKGGQYSIYIFNTTEAILDNQQGQINGDISLQDVETAIIDNQNGKIDGDLNINYADKIELIINEESNITGDFRFTGVDNATLIVNGAKTDVFDSKPYRSFTDVVLNTAYGAKEDLVFKHSITNNNAFAIYNSLKFDSDKVVNNGEIYFKNDNHYATLTMTGDYVGNNAVVKINAVNKETNNSQDNDKLVINGTASGHTHIIVENEINTRFEDPLLIVETQSSTNDAFSLSVQPNQTYDYDFLMKEEAGKNNWYLYQSLVPYYYSVRGANIANNFFSHSLCDRYANNAQNRFCNNDSRDVWVRSLYSNAHSQLQNSQIEQDSNTYGFQLGMDWGNKAFKNGNLKFGVMAGYAQSKGDFNDLAINKTAKSRMTMTAGGLYATYYNRSGFYVDSWLQYVYAKDSVHYRTSTAERLLHFWHKGLLASMEMGYETLVHKTDNFKWFITPQAQVILQNVHQHHDSFETLGRNNLQSRLGVRSFLQYEKVAPFVELNYLHNTNPIGIFYDNQQYRLAGNRNMGSVKFGFDKLNLTKNLNMQLSTGFKFGANSHRETDVLAEMRYIF